MRFVLALGLLFTPAVALSNDYVDSSIKRAAEKVGVPERLLRAVCFAESRLKPWAYVYKDGKGEGNHAFGMCQVLAETGASFVGRDEGCFRDFRTARELQRAGVSVPPDFEPLKRTYENCKLFGPYTNAVAAAKVLKYHLNRYGDSWHSAIAAYNTGSLKICRDGWVRHHGKPIYRCVIGGILNQRYVDRVVEALMKRY